MYVKILSPELPKHKNEGCNCGMQTQEVNQTSLSTRMLFWELKLSNISNL